MPWTICLLALVIGCGPGAAGARADASADSTPAMTTFRARFADYLAMPGGQIVYIPDGTWSGDNGIGQLTSAHAHVLDASQPYSGWLILAAEHPGHVTVDLAKLGFSAAPGTASQHNHLALRILFVGIDFIHGGIQAGAGGDFAAFDHFGLWYGDVTYPESEWNAQYMAAGGDLSTYTPDPYGGTVSLPNPFATGVRNQAMADDPSSNIYVMGTDLHDLGDDGVFVTGATGVAVHGARIWNIGHSSDAWKDQYWHSDTFQSAGSSSHHTVTDSVLATADVIIGTEFGSHNTGFAFDRLWLAGSNGAEVILDASGLAGGADGSGLIGGHIDSVRTFCAGQAHTSDPGWDAFVLEYASSTNTRVSYNGSSGQPTTLNLFGPPQLAMHVTNVDYTIPSGIAVTANSGGIPTIDDITQVIDDPSNPALQWRASHSVTDWAAFMTAQNYWQ